MWKKHLRMKKSKCHGTIKKFTFITYDFTLSILNELEYFKTKMQKKKKEPSNPTGQS